MKSHRWKPEHVQVLLAMAAKGSTANEIALVIGCSPGGVYKKALTFGVRVPAPPRPSNPTRRQPKPEPAPLVAVPDLPPILVSRDSVRDLAERMRLAFTGRRIDLLPINRIRAESGLRPVWCRELSL